MARACSSPKTAFRSATGGWARALPPVSPDAGPMIGSAHCSFPFIYLGSDSGAEAQAANSVWRCTIPLRGPVRGSELSL